MGANGPLEFDRFLGRKSIPHRVLSWRHRSMAGLFTKGCGDISAVSLPENEGNVGVLDWPGAHVCHV